MPKSIKALAPAKINLTFDIRGKRPDGYHEVETLLQAIDLQDEIVVELVESAEFSAAIHCTNDVVPARFPLDDSNLMAKAARLYFERARLPEKYRVSVWIEKNIPVGAGLAGGSTDAAAVLAALDALFGCTLGAEALPQLAGELGADVPFCLTGGTAVGTGRGDRLRSVQNEILFSFCIVKPRRLHVATAWAYQRFDAFKDALPRCDLHGAEAALREGNIEAALKCFGNVFEPVIFAEFPELVPVKAQLAKYGCWYCQLSGSGPALFAIVADREQAHYIRRKVLKTDDLEFDYIRLSTPDFGPPLEFYIAQSLSTGVKLVPHTVQVNG